MINEPETTLYAIGEPMLPGLPGVSVALCVAVATLVIAVASFLLANRASDDRERNIGDPFGSFTLPHDLVTVYFCAALAAFALHLAEFATLRLLGGDSSAPLFVLVVLGYVALAASAAFVLLAVRESPDRPPSVLAGVVGAIVGFFSGWAMLYSQKCADLLGADLGMTVLFILAAGGFPSGARSNSCSSRIWATTGPGPFRRRRGLAGIWRIPLGAARARSRAARLQAHCSFRLRFHWKASC